MAGRCRMAARARVSGSLPTGPVTCPDGRVALRPLQGLVSPGGQFLLVRPLIRFCAQRPGRFHRGEEPPRCRPRAGTAQAFQFNPPEGGEGRGIWLGPRRSMGFPGIRRHGSMRAHRAFAAGGLVPHSIRKSWGKKGDFFLKPKIERYEVLPNGVFIPHV